VGEASGRRRPAEAPDHHDHRPESRPMTTGRMWYPLTGSASPPPGRAGREGGLVDPLAGPRLPPGQPGGHADDAHGRSRRSCTWTSSHLAVGTPRKPRRLRGVDVVGPADLFPGSSSWHNHLSTTPCRCRPRC
jgi:hypothetical protein